MLTVIYGITIVASIGTVINLVRIQRNIRQAQRNLDRIGNRR